MFFHHQLFIQRRAKRIELILPYIYNNIQKENCLSNFFFPLFFYCSLKIISETYMHTLSHPSLLLNEVLNTESRGPPKCQEERSFQSTNGLNLTANYHFVFTLTHKRERDVGDSIVVHFFDQLQLHYTILELHISSEWFLISY